jgi:2-haloacid dehalogenase
MVPFSLYNGGQHKPEAAMDIRALVFDVFGTVVDWRGSIIRDGEALGARKGLKVDWPAFADAWRAEYQPAMAAVRKGERPFVKLDVLHRENLERIIPRFGLGGLDEAERDTLNRAWHRLDPWPDVVAGLTRLKRKHIIATLSNGNVALMVNMAKRAGLPWDAILGAEVARAYKPQPEAYLSAADMLGLKPEQCLMTAAHNGDLVAAAKCGLRTAFVRRPQEHGPGQKTDQKAEHAFDFDVRDFNELADRLGA